MPLLAGRGTLSGSQRDVGGATISIPLFLSSDRINRLEHIVGWSLPAVGWVNLFVGFCYSNPNMRPGFAAQGAQHVIGVGDEGFLPPRSRKLSTVLTLGSMRNLRHI